MKLGIIGCGKMGGALLRGVLAAGVYAKSEVLVSDAVAEAAAATAKECGVAVAADNATLAEGVETIVLCVKPADALALLRKHREALADKLVISIVAGMRLEALEEAAGPGVRVVRVMPNTPAQIHRGASAYALGSAAAETDARVTEEIFSAVGIAKRVPESLLDAVTGLSGSGPAYVYLMIEALSDAGVLMGLSRDLSLQLAASTVAGAAEMVLQTGMHPATLRDAVTSPGGTTIAGVEALEAAGVRSALLRAVRAATERSMELGKR